MKKQIVLLILLTLSSLELANRAEAQTVRQTDLMPRLEDYYGPNEALRAALVKDENNWKMIYREAIGNDRRVEVSTGTLDRLYPDVRISTWEIKPTRSASIRSHHGDRTLQASRPGWVGKLVLRSASVEFAPGRSLGF